GTVLGGRWNILNCPQWNGSTGTTTGGSTPGAATCHQQNTRQSTTISSSPRPGRGRPERREPSLQQTRGTSCADTTVLLQQKCVAASPLRATTRRPTNRIGQSDIATAIHARSPRWSLVALIGETWTSWHRRGLCRRCRNGARSR